MAITKNNSSLRGRVCEVIEIGYLGDAVSRTYDILNMLSIVVNLTVSILYTFEEYRTIYGSTLEMLEAITVAFFAVDYVLRLWTSKCLYPHKTELQSLLTYVFSFKGIVDVLSFLPHYLPIFFPSGAAAFRLFRVMRFFRLFRINAYYDSFNVITEVIVSRKQQLISSVFIIATLMIASSLCMYSLEHEAQPDVFKNAFSGIWWSVSTLLTVGYGDIYPITTTGKIFSIFITFLGVGMVAIPTGIISAGFVDQFSRIKRMSEYEKEKDINFIKIHLDGQDSWSGRTIKELQLPRGVLVSAIQRDEELFVPRGTTLLQSGDTIVLGAPSFDDGKEITLKEIVLRKQHPWTGEAIRNLDISRQTMILTVRRSGMAYVPNGDFVLLEGDTVTMYTQKQFSHTHEIHI